MPAAKIRIAARADARSVPVLCLLFAFGAVTAEAQQAAMIFDAPEVVGDGQSSIAGFGDLDGDGDTDLLSAGTVAGIIYFGGIRNDGAAGWVKTPTLPLAATPVVPPSPVTLFVRPADLDGDGDDDFVYANNAGVAALFSVGAAQAPSLGWYFFDATAVQGLVVVDYDDDGVDDFALITATELRLYRSQGLSPPTLIATASLAGYSRWQLAAVDWDGAPPRDVVLLGANSSNSASTVRVYPVLPSGTFGAASTFSVTVNVDFTFVVGDADGDGDEDVAASDGNGMRLLRRVSPSQFVPEAPIASVYANAFHDLNGDGYPEAIRSSGTSVYSSVEAGLGIGGLTFFPVAPWFAALGGHNGVHFGDLDGDGDDDVAFGRGVAYGGQAARRQEIAGGGVTQARISDFDGDGDPDLHYQIALFNFNGPPTLRNDGTGTFAPNGVGPSSFSQNGGIPIDFDGDGRLDLLAGDAALRNRGGSSLENLGPAISASHFMTPVGASVTLQNADNARTADLDSDGDQDVIVRIPYSPVPSSMSAAIWWNLGGGQFDLGPVFPQREIVGVVDADGDGDPDLATYRHLAGTYLTTGSGEIRIWRNEGGGSFVVDDQPGAWPAIETVATVLVPPAFGDLDDDGDQDALVFGLGSARLLQNLGGGAFSTWATYTEFGPQLVGTIYVGGGGRLVDVDDDGRTDVVLFGTLADSGSVTILRRTGPATFAPAVRQALTPTAFADVDGDGDLDVFETTRLHRNLRYAPPEAGSKRQYGTGNAATPGAAPRLGARGPSRAGETVTIVAASGIGGQSGALVVGGAPGASFFFGYPLLVEPELLVPLTFDGAPGPWPDGSWSATFVVPPWFAGGALYFQAWATDPAGPMALACSNGLELRFGL